MPFGAPPGITDHTLLTNKNPSGLIDHEGDLTLDDYVQLHSMLSGVGRALQLRDPAGLPLRSLDAQNIQLGNSLRFYGDNPYIDSRLAGESISLKGIRSTPVGSETVAVIAYGATAGTPRFQIVKGKLTGTLEANAQIISDPKISEADYVVIQDGAGHYLQLPTLTTAERDALTPVNGMVIYNSTTGQVEQYSGGAWTGVPITAHEASHEVGGAAEMNLAGLRGIPLDVFPRATFNRLLYEPWKNLDGWTEGLVGTGTLDLILNRLQLRTGATDASRKTVYCGGAFFHPVAGSVKFAFPFLTATAMGDSEFRAYIVGNGATLQPLSDTGHHAGFKIIDGIVYLSNADGTTEKTTNTGIDLSAQYAGRRFDLRGTGSGIGFYADEILQGTHEVNLPGVAFNYYIVFELKNTAAVDKRVNIYPVTLLN